VFIWPWGGGGAVGQYLLTKVTCEENMIHVEHEKSCSNIYPVI
jgi:hypothetical protein